MPLQPSRRLPKAYQRHSSPFSRNVAKRYARKGRRGLQFHLTKLGRQWRRLARHIHIPFQSVWLWSAGIALLFILILLLYFLFSPTFAVFSIRVVREDRRVDVEEIQELLKPLFGKHILFVSPRHLERQIESAYPEVTATGIRRVFPNELRVTLSMDPIVAEVLIGEPDDTESAYAALSKAVEEATAERTYAYLTERGVYLEYLFPFPPKAQEERIILHLVDWAVKPTHRQSLISNAGLQNIVSVRRILRQSFGHNVQFISLYLRAREFHVQTEGHVLWFDLSSPAASQINRYRSFLSTISLDKVQEYLDLRLHDRVVYR
jgi:hypothetical protein